MNISFYKAKCYINSETLSNKVQSKVCMWIVIENAIYKPIEWHDKSVLLIDEAT